MTIFPPLYTCTVGVVGLGYVGLPLAVEFSRTSLCVRTHETLARHVVAFDINTQRLSELATGFDRTREVPTQILNDAESLQFTNDISKLALCDVFIVSVPTPVDSAKIPDLQPLQSATKTVGQALKIRSHLPVTTCPIVIFESTVFPGATEEVCVPILEYESGLKFNSEFFCGYSPERINPGDPSHSLTSICKVTSGSTPDTAIWIDQFYGSIITAGTHNAASIKVAEAAKVIENTQRDLNIALINELAIIFHKLGIDTNDVLTASSSKWNFLPFKPGLVGGHCIGVDPYYLTYKAEQLGYHPQLVLAGRRINDSMPSWIVENLVLEMAQRGISIVNAKVLVLGFSFKANCPDVRNTKVADLVSILHKYSMVTTIVDPCIDLEETRKTYQHNITTEIPTNSTFDVVITAVRHNEFTLYPPEFWLAFTTSQTLFVDLCNLIPRTFKPLRL